MAYEEDPMGTYLAKTPGLQVISYYVNQFADRSLRDKISALVGGAHTAIMRKDFWTAIDLLIQAADTMDLDTPEYHKLVDLYEGIDHEINNLSAPIKKGWFVPLSYLFSEQQFPEQGRVLITIRGYIETSRDIDFDSKEDDIPYGDILEEIAFSKDIQPTQGLQHHPETEQMSEMVTERYLGSWYRLVAASWRNIRPFYKKVRNQIESQLDYWPEFGAFIDTSTKMLNEITNSYLNKNPLEIFISQWNNEGYSKNIPDDFFDNLHLQQLSQKRRLGSSRQGDVGRLPFTNDDIYNVRGLATDAREPQQDLLRSLTYTERLVNYLIYGVWSLTGKDDNKALHSNSPKDDVAKSFLTNYSEVVSILRYTTYAHGSKFTPTEFHHLNKLRSLAFRTAVLGQTFVMQLVKWVLAQDPHAGSRGGRRSSTHWESTPPPPRPAGKKPTTPQQKELKVEAKVVDKKPVPAKKPTKKSVPSKSNSSVPRMSPKNELADKPPVKKSD